jgi:hypothetical protein
MQYDYNVISGIKEAMSNQTSSVEQLKQQRKCVMEDLRFETNVAVCMSRAKCSHK